MSTILFNMLVAKENWWDSTRRFQQLQDSEKTPYQGTGGWALEIAVPRHVIMFRTFPGKPFLIEFTSFARRKSPFYWSRSVATTNVRDGGCLSNVDILKRHDLLDFAVALMVCQKAIFYEKNHWNVINWTVIHHDRTRWFVAAGFFFWDYLNSKGKKAQLDNSWYFLSCIPLKNYLLSYILSLLWREENNIITSLSKL